MCAFYDSPLARGHLKNNIFKMPIRRNFLQVPVSAYLKDKKTKKQQSKTFGPLWLAEA